MVALASHVLPAHVQPASALQDEGWVGRQRRVSTLPREWLCSVQRGAGGCAAHACMHAGRCAWQQTSCASCLMRAPPGNSPPLALDDLVRDPETNVTSKLVASSTRVHRVHGSVEEMHSHAGGAVMPAAEWQLAPAATEPREATCNEVDGVKCVCMGGGGRAGAGAGARARGPKPTRKPVPITFELTRSRCFLRLFRRLLRCRRPMTRCRRAPAGGVLEGFSRASAVSSCGKSPSLPPRAASGLSPSPARPKDWHDMWLGRASFDNRCSLDIGRKHRGDRCRLSKMTSGLGGGFFCCQRQTSIEWATTAMCHTKKGAKKGGFHNCPANDSGGVNVAPPVRENR